MLQQNRYAGLYSSRRSLKKIILNIFRNLSTKCDPPEGLRTDQDTSGHLHTSSGKIQFDLHDNSMTHTPPVTGMIHLSRAAGNSIKKNSNLQKVHNQDRL